MALTPFPLLGGVIKDDTPLSAEGFVTDCDKMRWRRKKWETIGGWEVATQATFEGIARGGHAWADLAGTRAAAFGTAAKLYAYYGGDVRDITPVKAQGTIVNGFQTELGSTVVLVLAPVHGLKNTDVVTFSGADPVGGVTVNGSYSVEILTADIFRIVTGTTATSSATGGGRVDFTAPFDVGLVNGIGGLGYGSGAFGTGPYGVASAGDIHARVWSLDNFGNNLVACPTNGALYEWQPQSAYPELVVNGSFTTTANWFTSISTLVGPFTTLNASATVTVAHTAHGMITGDKVTFRNATAVGGLTIAGEYTITVTGANAYTITAASNATSAATGGGLVEVEQPKNGTNSNGWNITGGKAVATAGRASQIFQDMTGILSGGVTYVLTLTLVVTAGRLQFRVISNPGTPVDFAFGEPFSKSGTYTFRFNTPPNPTFIKLAKDATFAGSVDDVSIKVESKAYRIQDAPPYSKDMFVDPNGFVVLLGTSEEDGDYNALCVRWSDQKNNRTWITNDDTLSREQILSQGSEIRGGLATRGQNMIWTDAALYTMRFTGTSTDVFRFDLIGTGCGLIHKNACIEHNGQAFWWGSNRNFYIYTGGIPQILDCPIRADVMDNLSPGQESKISCGVNSAYNEVWWFYPDARDGIECSRYVVYNWSENVWYVGTFARSQWIGDGVFQTPIALSTSGQIFFHELGKSANGDVLEWSLETAFLDMGDGERLMRVSRFVPDFEEQEGLITMGLTFKGFPAGAETTYSPYEIRTDTQKIDFRHTGRQMRARFTGAGAPSFARFGAIKMDISETGARR